MQVGLKPWYPWPLSRWRWWTEPVPAERLAALRIGLAAVLLLDLLTTYLPGLHDFFGPGSLGGPEVFPERASAGLWQWSLLAGVESPWVLDAAFGLWVLAAITLLLGLGSRPSALVAWLLSLSFDHLNPEIVNAGDSLRGIILFYLMLTPCGAAWSLDAWLRGRRHPGSRGQGIFIYPWALRLLFVQMVWIYFSNGLHKVAGIDWLVGTSLYYVLADLTLARWSYAAWPIPFFLTRLLSWAVLAWELLFPLLVLQRTARRLALGFGVAFHLGIWVSMELGGFPLYMLCLYLPLVPWERWRASGAKAGS
jgi:hypothetical protein